MRHQQLTNLSILAGFLGILAFLGAAIASFPEGNVWLFGVKQWYGAGAGLVLIAIWLKLGAIYHKP